MIEREITNVERLFQLHKTRVMIIEQAEAKEGEPAKDLR